MQEPLVLKKDREIEFARNYNNYDNYKYEDFPNEDIIYGNLYNIDEFSEGGLSYGKIANHSKQSKWLSGDADFD